MISDEDIKYFASVHVGGAIGEMATELLQLREEKRKAEEARAKSWEGAPEWVLWRAMDSDGTWWWFEEEPIKYPSCWDCPKGKIAEIGHIGSTWADTLEKRP